MEGWDRQLISYDVFSSSPYISLFVLPIPPLMDLAQGCLRVIMTCQLASPERELRGSHTSLCVLIWDVTHHFLHTVHKEGITKSSPCSRRGELSSTSWGRWIKESVYML